MTSRLLDVLVRLLVVLATVALLLMVWHRPAHPVATPGATPADTSGAVA